MRVLKIALCDDSPIQLRGIVIVLNKIQDYIKSESTHNITFDLELFENGLDLLARMQQTEFDVFILDIMMERLDGLDLAHKIQIRYHWKAHIILLTSYEKYALKAHEVGAFRYVLKNNMEDGLKKGLLHLLNILEGPIKPYTLSDHKLLLPAPPDSMYYLKSDNHYVLFFYGHFGLRQSPLYPGPLALYARTLAPFDFIYCHRSYLVNVRKINKIRYTELLLSNDVRIPIGRDRKTEIEEAYSAYRQRTDTQLS